jgi:hypothetical protein
MPLGRSEPALKQVGKYEVLGELGHGAMGVVYRARDPMINRLVALKTITSGVANDPEMLQRFYREAQAAGGLQHPNIVTIYDMGEAGSIPYIAMQLVEGENLEQLIARRSPLPLTLKLAYAMQACRAFDFAHKQGIVHRDIKPGNVMVSKDGTVKVVDFGIARVLDTSRTQTGMLIGTFAYMSPEQYYGEHADERSDIWSFGVLLYELLSYRRPFQGSTPGSLMHSICNEEPSPLNEILPDCPKELELVISKMLRKSLSERYESMEDVLLDLDLISKTLQTQSVADFLERAFQLLEQENYAEARDLVRQALQLEAGNQQARALLEKANAGVKRVHNRPKAQQLVEKGQALLGEGKLQEARVAAENALQLDSSFGPAEDLQHAIQKELDRARQVAEWLDVARRHVAEGLPDDAENLLAKVLEMEPRNAAAQNLQHQVLKEKAERERRRRLFEGMQQAHGLWTQQDYGDCIRLLQVLDQEFPGEEEVLRVLETVREDQLQQQRQQGMLQARNLLAAGRHGDAISHLSDLQARFPNHDEIPRLLEEVRKDQLIQGRSVGMAEARSLLAAGQYEASIALLTSLQKTFPDELEIPQLLDSACQAQAEQLRQRGIGEATKLLDARQYAESLAYLVILETQFPGDEEILELQKTVRKQQAEQEKQRRLEEARHLLAAHRLEECATLLSSLEKQFPNDAEILGLQNAIQEDLAKQKKHQGLEEVRTFLASKNYGKAIALLASLYQAFPNDEAIRKLLESTRKEEADHLKREGLSQARALLAARSYEESIDILSKLQADFPAEPEIAKLLATAREDLAEEQKQQKLTEARGYLAAQSFQKALQTLDGLLAAHPRDSQVIKLRTLAQNEYEKYSKAEKLQQELDALKKLMNEKKYAEVVARTKELLAQFPSEPKFVRLAEFAADQQANIEKELLLKKILEQAQACFHAGRFEEATRAAQDGLKAFPGNSDLQALRQESEVQQKKQQVRRQIEHRIREIRVKINREELSDAVELAKQTLSALGPDTDVADLLNSAQVEFHAREKKRIEERTVETIRLLIESGDLDGANRAIEDVLKSKTLDPFDPRVNRLSEQAQDARTKSAAGPLGTPPSGAPNLSKEYAFLHATPIPTPPASAENTAPQGSSTGQILGSSAVLPTSVSPPKQDEIAPAASERTGVQPQFQTGAPETEPTVKLPGPPTVQIEPPKIPSPAVLPSSVQVRPSTQQKTFFSKRATLAVALLAIAIFSVVLIVKRRNNLKVQPESQPVAGKRQETAAHPFDPLELQQRQLMEAANAKIAANDLDGSTKILQRAKALKGPLTPEIQAKLAQVNMQTNLIAQVERDLKLGDYKSARRTADQIKQDGGNSTELTVKIDRTELAELKRWEGQFAELKPHADSSAFPELRALQQKFQSLADDGGPHATEALNYAKSVAATIASVRGGDLTPKPGPKCGALKERLEMGETLGEDEQAYFKKSCR